MSRPAFKNDARLVLASTLAAAGVFLLLEALLRKSRDFSPDFLASVLLYGLTVLNFALLLVLAVMLGRNLVKVFVEGRRGVLGARLRLRLALALLAMALAPSALLVVVGSDLIRQTVDRWFSVDVERLLAASRALGEGLRERELKQARVHARLLAREVGARRLLEPAGRAGLRRTIEVRARDLGLDLVNVYGPDGEWLAVASPALPQAPYDEASAEPLAEAARAGRETTLEMPFAGGALLRVGVPVVGAGGKPAGAVVVSSFVPPELMAEAREVRERFDKFRQTEAAKEPIKAVYLSIFLFAALLVLFGAVWLALYLARRITTPLRLVAQGAERIAAGERGVRVDFPAGADEFGALIASFNRMSERLARSEEEVDHGRRGLMRKNEELEDRRRLMETVLETVGTGVVVVDAEATVTAVNAAACRLLDVDAAAVGRLLEDGLGRGAGRDELASLARRQLAGRGTRQEREVRVPLAGRDRHLAVTVVPLPGAPGTAPGAVLVLDDLTPLMRAQKVAAWGEVARKLAHEIKNPLTPIQLSAQRVRKAHVRQSPDLDRIVEEATGAIEHEVEALKNLVDEFAQFARLPAANLAPASLHEVIEQALSLYEGLFPDVKLSRELAADLPALRIDVEQIKRVVVNLVDNAIDAVDRRGTVKLTTTFDKAQARARLTVEDDGPGVPEADREKLFVPSFSTKRRGSGLGLAIVARIVQEHNGTIRVEDAQPHGARFVVDLPA
ncbi:MAG: ATP-binding protein [Vicinamibacteria bacterium]|nr:ATP-binding protein [Vicinamibacteria bacterium]